MDVVVNAAIQSPLVRTLSATKGKGDTFVHNIKDNVPPVSFGKVELSPRGGAVGTYNRNYQFEIPQYGYWRGLILKFQASENGLGTQVIQDIYNSLTTSPQYCDFYGESAGILYAQYRKSGLFGSLRNGYGAIAPNNQTFVPQGWVSPFDANVRSGNYDPWESMWLRLMGGNSYGNQANAGTYPNPQLVSSKGDARIAPFRHTPRFDALNSFGRNVHCIGNASYDDGNTAGNNQLNPAACGYNIDNATTGAASVSLTSATLVNGVPSGTSITGASGDDILSATTVLSNVPKGSTLGNNVPFNCTNGLGVPGGLSPGVYIPYQTSDQRTTVVASTTSGTAINATIGGTGAGESVAFGMQIARDNVPYNASSTGVGGNVPTVGSTFGNYNNIVSISGSGGVQNNVPYGASTISNVISSATLNANVPFNNTPPVNGGVAGAWFPQDANLWGFVSNVPSGCTQNANVVTSSTTMNGVPYGCSFLSGKGVYHNDAGNVSNITSVPYGVSLFSGIPGGNGGAVNLRGGVPYSASSVSVLTSASTTTNVPFNQLTSRLGVFCDLTTLTNNKSSVPYGATLDSTVMSTTGSTARAKVPYNATLVNGVVSGAVTGSTVDASNMNVSGELDWSFLVPFDGCMFHQVPIYTTSGDHKFYLQPDGQYAAIGTSNGGSGGWAGSTPPAANTNTQMRNRYLGQRLASTYDWCSQANLSRYLGALMVVTVTLSSHKRVLQTIYPTETLARIYRMPIDQKRKWLSMIRPHILTSPSSIAAGDTQTPGYSGGVNTTGVSWMRNSTDAYQTYRSFVCYFPCFFSFFESPQANLDTRFTENLVVDVLVQPMQNIYDPCDLGLNSGNLGTTYNFNDTTQDDRAVFTTYTGFHSQEFRQRVAIINTALSVTALAYYHNFHDATSQSIRDYNYRPDVAANLLGYNTYAEAPVQCPAVNVTTGGTININLTCNNLTTEIIFCVRRRVKDVTAHPQLASFPFDSYYSTLPVASIALSASGQLIYAATGVECMLADQWDFDLNNVKTGSATTNDSSLYADAHESYYAQSKPTCDGFFAYRIPFSFSTDRTYNSGCLALQTLHNPVLSIQLLPLHGWVINDDNLAFRMGSLLNLSENLNQRECDTQTVFDNDFQIEIYENYFQLVRVDSNTGKITKSLDL